ncbi:MAG: hypothetical protein H6822_33305 [Planctomycetaceae bacterium]|nr:hypothetical protein [Planctomycetales bacterium]MCB9927065.1 hypothetical protein [Planctomycetaceae bacterium]
MSARGLEEFPPHWEPPLRIGYGEAEPDVFDLLEIVTRETPSSWLRGVVVEKILFQSNANAFTHDRLINLSEVDEADLETYVELLKSAPNGSKLAASHQFEIDRIFQDADDPEFGSPITDARRELLMSLRRLRTDKNDVLPE